MRKLLLLLLGVVCIAGSAMAQRIVTGKVVDEKGSPVANASVLVKGTTTGTITKVDGTFSFTVPASARSLIISAVDMAAIEVAIGADNHVDVTLRPEDKTMAEVVVTGYGTQRRRDVTGNIASVKGTLVANKPVQSFEQALAGRATGVQITVPHGLLNTPPVFRIRGTNSISLSSYPLIVVDGVPTPTGDFSATAAAGNALSSINPADIESIDIAKDAAATAIYGSRAANGVVFITTKKGRSGKPRVSYNGSMSWTKVTRLPEILNAQQYTDFKNKAAANNANVNTTNPSGPGYTRFATATDASGKLIDTYWPDQVYRQGFSHDHNLSIAGGNDNTTYYFSVGYTDQEGIIKKNDFLRRNILLNIDSRVNEWFTVGGKISYSNGRNLAANTSGSLPGEAFNTGGFGRIVLVNAPSVAPFKNDGTYNIENPAANSVGRMNNTVTVGFYNPTLILDLNRQYSESNHSQGNVYAQIKPVKWLAIKSLYGIDYLFVDNETFLTPIHGDGFTPNGSASSTLGKFKRWTWVNTAQFDYTFRTNHTVSALVGTEQDRRTNIGFGVNRTTLSDPAFTVIQAGWVTPNVAGMAYGENFLLSTFGRLNYDFKKKYFLAGNIRKDEYSAFAEKASTFWGASAGWDVSKEAFWEKSSISNWVNNFRLRGSYGKVGNTAGIGDYVIFSTYGSGLYGGLPTLIFNFAGNPNLQWETSSKIDVGTTFAMFRDRLQVELTRYYNDIKDLILNVPQAPSTGVPNAIPTNIGTMYNKGWELSITGLPFRKRDFNWSTTLNITTNKNEVTSLAPGLNEVLTSTSGLETVHRTAVGYSVGTLWLVRNGGVDPATGRRILLNKAGQPVLYAPPGSGAAFTWSNPDGTQYSEPGQPVGVGVTQAKDGVMYGNTIPKVYGGLDNTFRYKDFELSVLLTYQFGFYVYYGTNAGLHDMRFWNNHVDVLKAWSKPGDIATIPKPVYLDNVSNGSALPMSFNAFKGDFVKLKNLTLSYNLPAKVVNKAKLATARIYVGGQNLAIFTDYPGPDPEVSSNGNSNTAQGTDRNTIANGRNIIVGINVSFL